jgi:hypothetical protein
MAAEMPDQGNAPLTIPGDEAEGGASSSQALLQPPSQPFDCEVLPSKKGPVLSITCREDGRRILLEANEAGLETAINRLQSVTSLPRQDLEAQIANLISEARSNGMRQRQPDANGRGSFLAGVIDSVAFASSSFPRDWLIKGMLVRGQPVIIGGPQKSLKTTVVIDLALSLGSGAPFLGKFDVPLKTRVLALSGESGQATLQETAKRVSAAKNLDLAEVDILWGFDLPQLTSREDVSRLEGFIREQQVRVVIIDPLYLALQGLDLTASNMFAVGPNLRRIALMCQNTETTLVLVHHSSKSASMSRALLGEPLDLLDLAYAGFAEFARQWLLLSRREPYEQGTGTHLLWLKAGGSAGHGALWALDIEEGVLDESFGGRQWQVTVVDGMAARAQAANERERKKEEKKEGRMAEIQLKVLEALAKSVGGDSLSGLCTTVSASKEGIRKALAALKQGGIVEECEVRKSGGRGERGYDGWRLTEAGWKKAVEARPELAVLKPVPLSTEAVETFIEARQGMKPGSSPPEEASKPEGEGDGPAEG